MWTESRRVAQNADHCACASDTLRLSFPYSSQELLYLSELIVWQKWIESVRHIPRTLCTAKESADENSLQHLRELIGLFLSKAWVAFTQIPR